MPSFPGSPSSREIGYRGAPLGLLAVPGFVGLSLVGAALWYPWSLGTLWPLALGGLVLAGVCWVWHRRAAVLLEPAHLVVRERRGARTIPLTAVRDARERWSLWPDLHYAIVVRLAPEAVYGRELRFRPRLLEDLGGPPGLAEQIRLAAAAEAPRVGA